MHIHTVSELYRFFPELTPWSRVLLEKLVKKISAFY
jgi:hypothetical protein